MGEVEVAEDVRPELEVVPLGSELFDRRVLSGGVVDQDVKRTLLADVSSLRDCVSSPDFTHVPEKLFRGPLDRLEASEVKQQEKGFSSGFLTQHIDDSHSLLFVPRC